MVCVDSVEQPTALRATASFAATRCDFVRGGMEFINAQSCEVLTTRCQVGQSFRLHRGGMAESGILGFPDVPRNGDLAEPGGGKIYLFPVQTSKRGPNRKIVKFRSFRVFVDFSTRMVSLETGVGFTGFRPKIDLDLGCQPRSFFGFSGHPPTAPVHRKS